MPTVAARRLPRLLVPRPGVAAEVGLFAALLLLLAALVGYPLGRVLVAAVTSPEGLTLGRFPALFARGVVLEALGNTLVAGVAAVAFGSLVALPLALLIARYDFPGRALVETLGILPLVVPPFVGAVAFQQVLGRSGTVNLLLLERFGFTVPFMEGLTGVILVQTLHYFPFILVNTAVALRGIDRSAEEAAQTLGCHGVRLLRRVTLPLALPGFVAGALLTFIGVIDDLGTPLMLDYTKLLAPQAYLRVTTAGMNDADGDVVCVILLALSLLALWGAKAFLGRSQWTSLARGPERVPRRLRGRATLGAWLLAGVLLGLALLPHAGIVALSFAGAWSSSPLPTRYTLDNYAEILFRAPHVVWNTLRYAVLAAGADVVLGAAIAWLLLRGRVAGRAVLDAIAMAPLAIPGVVLAIGYVRVFHGRDVPGLGQPLTDTGLILVIAYMVRRLPYTARAAYATLQQMPVSLEESAQSLGAPPRRTFRRITLPLMARGLVAGGLIAFVTAAVEFSSTVVLVPRVDLAPLSYAVYSSMQSAAGRGPGAALGVIAIVLVVAGTLLVNRLSSRGAGSAFNL